MTTPSPFPRYFKASGDKFIMRFDNTSYGYWMPKNMMCIFYTLPRVERDSDWLEITSVEAIAPLEERNNEPK